MTVSLYPEGVYQARVLKQSFEHALTTDTIQFVMALRIQGRYDDEGLLVACPPEIRYYRHSVNSRNACLRLRAELIPLGHMLKGLTELIPGRPDSIDFVGRDIDVSCDVETFEGRPRERWNIKRRRLAASAEVEGLQAFFGEVFSDLPTTLQAIADQPATTAQEEASPAAALSAAL
ncbi:MAG: hypothetical protein JNM56_15160 [Planctomycetia bacterium]|nr:hypothetical protein [Planctomycetia bacterium]